MIGAVARNNSRDPGFDEKRNKRTGEGKESKYLTLRCAIIFIDLLAAGQFSLQDLGVTNEQ